MSVYTKHSDIWKEIAGNPDFTSEASTGLPYAGGVYVCGFKNYWLLVGRDETTSLWKTNQTDSPGTSSTDDGLANTNSINNTTHPAARWCKTYTSNVIGPWSSGQGYLPSIEELYVIYLNRTKLNSMHWIGTTIGTGIYWSSTQAQMLPEGGWTSYALNFSNGNVIAVNKCELGSGHGYSIRVRTGATGDHVSVHTISPYQLTQNPIHRVRAVKRILI